MKIFVAHSSAFAFDEKLYKPLRDSNLNTTHEILLPQEHGSKEEITREMIRTCDALVAEVSIPSLGAGIEMGWANAFNVPIIAIHEEGSAVSFSIDNVVHERFAYTRTDDMLIKLSEALNRLAR